MPNLKKDCCILKENGKDYQEIQNDYIRLSVDAQGRIRIATIEGGVIMSDLVYYASHDSSGYELGLRGISVACVDDSTIVIRGSGTSGEDVKLSLKVSAEEPRLDVQVSINYTKETTIWREALIGCFDVPVTEVYRKNGKADLDNLQQEYWLDDQGVRFGSGRRSALIYHNPSLSSLQLKPEERMLIFNLDYFRDHPHIYFPYQEDGAGRWVNLSQSAYNKDSKRENSFSIHFGIQPLANPRLMLVPHGYLAGYIFTEHADETNLRTHRAVYFGSEDIVNVADATGGFAGHGIPVTKSVFYTDTSGPSVREDPDFLNFLDQLNTTGQYEICLHTPDFNNSNRGLLNESVKLMKERFETITWIDHGFYDGRNNRESFVCDGLNSASRYYASDLWKKYGTYYFWNTAIESINNLEREQINRMSFFRRYVEKWRDFFPAAELREMGFPNAFMELIKHRNSSRFEINTLEPVKGEAYPTPIFYQHPAFTGEFYSWVTGYVKFYTDLSANSVKTEHNLLNKLITDWGIFINHGYFPRIRNGRDVVNDESGKIIIDPYFDHLLEKMSKMKEEGNLYITTIRDLLGYRILTEKVAYKYLPDSSICICNNNNVPINGLSLAIRAKNAITDSPSQQSKRVGDDIILWFDIPANGNVILRAEI